MSSRRAQQRAAATGSVYDDSSLGSKSGSKSSAGAPKTHSGMNRGSGSGAGATTLSSIHEESTKPVSSSQSISAPAQDSSRVITSSSSSSSSSFSSSTSTVVASRLPTE